MKLLGSKAQLKDVWMSRAELLRRKADRAAQSPEQRALILGEAAGLEMAARELDRWTETDHETEGDVPFLTLISQFGAEG
jgi:hypothetical protein